MRKRASYSISRARIMREKHRSGSLSSLSLSLSEERERGVYGNLTSYRVRQITGQINSALLFQVFDKLIGRSTVRRSVSISHPVIAVNRFP